MARAVAKRMRVRGRGWLAWVRRSMSLGRTERTEQLKKRGWPAASRRSSPLVIPSLHSSVTCAISIAALTVMLEESFL